MKLDDPFAGLSAALDRALVITKQLEQMTCAHEWEVYWTERVCQRCGLHDPICNHSIDEKCDCAELKPYKGKDVD